MSMTKDSARAIPTTPLSMSQSSPKKKLHLASTTIGPTIVEVTIVTTENVAGDSYQCDPSTVERKYELRLTLPSAANPVQIQSLKVNILQPILPAMSKATAHCDASSFNPCNSRFRPMEVASETSAQIFSPVLLEEYYKKCLLHQWKQKQLDLFQHDYHQASEHALPERVDSSQARPKNSECRPEAISSDADVDVMYRHSSGKRSTKRANIGELGPSSLPTKKRRSE